MGTGTFQAWYPAKIKRFALIVALSWLMTAAWAGTDEGQHGSHAGASASSGIPLPVTVRIPGRNFEIGKYEITRQQWRAVMGRLPPDTDSLMRRCDDCPATEVSWNDVQIFLQKLNEATGRQYRLPTAEEWEFACRGGGQLRYCGSDAVDEIAWFCENAGGRTHPVGQKKPNGYGLFDMVGNVQEWVQDRYDGEHGLRELRGDSFLCHLPIREPMMRSYNDASYRNQGDGFRLARTVQAP